MKLLGKSTTPELSITVREHFDEICLKQLHIKPHMPYCDADSFAVTGAESVSLAKSDSQADFIRNFNESSELLSLDIQNNYFTLTPRVESVLSGTPGGIFENISKRMLLYDDSGWIIEDYPEFNILSGETFFFDGGLNIDYQQLLTLSGTFSSGTVHNAQAFTAASDMPIVGDPLTSRAVMQVVTQNALVEHGIVSMGSEAVVRSTTDMSSTIRIDVHGPNSGFLMNSPRMAIVSLDSMKELHSAESRANSAKFSFQIRALSVYSVHNGTVYATVPADCRFLEVFRDANGRVNVQAVRKSNSPTVLVVRSDFAVSALDYFCFLGFVQVDVKLPEIINRAADTTRDGSWVAAVKTPTSNDYNLYVSQKHEIAVASGKLWINGVNTNISIAQQADLVIAVAKDVRLDVSVIDYTNNTTGAYESAVDESFTHNTGSTAVPTWKTGATFGPWGVSKSVTRLDRLLQIVKSRTKLSPAKATLGVLTNGTFADGSTFDSATGTLTWSSESFDRKPVTLSAQLQNILRMSSEITGKTTGSRKAYTNRVERTNVFLDGLHVQGFNGTSLIGSVAEEVPAEHWHLVKEWHPQVICSYEFVDAQTNRVVGTKLPSKEPWSIELATRIL